MKPSRATTLLGACIALALAAGAAAETPKPKARTADAATQAQLDAAQADLQRAAKRVAELQAKLGVEGTPGVHVFERRMVNKPIIGVVLAPDAQAGVRVAGVTPESGAAKAGLRAGDRITAVAGTQVLGSNGDLRMENARKLFTGLDEGKPVRIDYVRAGKATTVNVTPSKEQDVFWVGTPGEGGPQIRRIEIPGVGDGVRQEVIRIGPRGDCKGKDCKVPMLAEAFRWNGLNLASVDAKLGRYFGTDKGVLVLSAGADLQGLQPGDVIQKIDGRAVGSPREAMEALRAKDGKSMALVEYMRDRRVASTRVQVPELNFKFITPPPPPPAPPAPPAPPTAPRVQKATPLWPPPSPPTPPPPPSAFMDEEATVITLDARV
ncbi:PDZ/DHR/GLGF domain protein [Lysobacter dokdonensis DS-58]|uniref:PDZ/DHR/GLGF domain protein n=1 Tax=Lysobacter dokdonensis DS-58 TaxID=1300345 RepID=A0A0A2WER1_9GAMM|nr:PDZ domain-containing protein [Lysobacter dokdonensis]KGQ18671.1 PDZ/DHR/GLGF domain protein [Lysobacter dokdonensis DS-58]